MMNPENNAVPGPHTPKWVRRSCVLIAAFMIVLAFVAGFRYSHDLTWPPYVDSDRDASFAQSVLEGKYGEDPLYKGEFMWFTPILFALEAAVVQSSGVSIQEFQARAGAYMNLLGPLAFFLMAWRLFGPLIALSALVAHLFFIPGQEPGWAVASYAPWLLPMILTQALFYIMIIVLYRAHGSRSAVVWALAGSGAGLLFMSHAAPAVLLVGMIAIHLISCMVKAWRAADHSSVRAYLLCALASGAAFILITLPLTWFVIGEYGLDQQNRQPAAYTYLPLSLRHFRLFLLHNLSLFNGIGLVGILMLIRSKNHIVRNILRSWIGLALFLALFAYAAVTLGVHYGLKLPMSVPSFHYYFYLKSALALGFGVASVAVIRWTAQLVRPKGDAVNWSDLTPIFVMSIVILLVIAQYPTYANRPDLMITRQRSLKHMADPGAVNMSYHMREHLPWEAVVLCDEELSTWILMASARKTVATHPSMSNPYVLPGPRESDRDLMFQGLIEPIPEMTQLLKDYDVSHLLIRTTDSTDLAERPEWFPVLVHRSEGYLLYARN